jgi:hypothetical protein
MDQLRIAEISCRAGKEAEKEAGTFSTSIEIVMA